MNAAAGSRQPARRVLLIASLVAAAALFASLGLWQLRRLAWKEALIARVEARVHAAAVEPPARGQWPAVNADNSEYLHVHVTGRYLRDRDTLVRAATVLGSGYWVLTPLLTASGDTILVNRGFVSMEARRTTGQGGAQPAAAGAVPVSVTGLLRISEPHGSLLQANRPAEDRWYSRDVAAIAAARGLTQVAPFFIDAAAAPADAAAPVGGLTVLSFPNNHRQYAFTWFGLALLAGVAGILAPQLERRG